MTRVLENLKGKKPYHQRQGLSLSPETGLTLSSVQKKPYHQRHPNKKKLTKRSVTNKGSDSLPPSSISNEEKRVGAVREWALNMVLKPKSAGGIIVDEKKEQEQIAKLRRQAEELKKGADV